MKTNYKHHVIEVYDSSLIQTQASGTFETVLLNRIAETRNVWQDGIGSNNLLWSDHSNITDVNFLVVPIELRPSSLVARGGKSLQVRLKYFYAPYSKLYFKLLQVYRHLSLRAKGFDVGPLAGWIDVFLLFIPDKETLQEEESLENN